MTYLRGAAAAATLLIIVLGALHYAAGEEAGRTGIVQNKSGNLVTILMDDPAPLTPGASFEVYTFFSKRIFGMDTTGWLNAAEAKLVRMKDRRVEIRITAEKSPMTVNNKKVVHLKRGVRVRLVVN
ncbi:MAG: hypothetical protein JW838_05745 [Spirochaetes bacterium]|nr:hypothetical protein [Spirochaetota bacterium]